MHPSPLERLRPQLASLGREIADALGDAFVGMYVYGSLATGDWHERTSDIDCLVVLRRPPDDGERRKLAALHRAASKTEVGAKIEADYVELDVLRSKDRSGAVCAVHGGEFRSAVPCPVSADNVLALLRHGVAILGEPVEGLGLAVSDAELRASVCAMFAEDRERLETADEGMAMDLLIDALRCMYARATGLPPTKREAIDHHRELLGPDLHAALVAFREGKKHAAVDLTKVRAVIEAGAAMMEGRP